VRWFIDEGHYQFFTADSIDNQSWSNGGRTPADRARRHEDYDRYITQELAPWIRQRVGEDAALLTTGVSMGGYHSANFFFRHPDIFDSLVSLSGLFQLSMFCGDYMDENVYFNSPLHYLRNMEDPWYLERYRRSKHHHLRRAGRLGR
jgi:esterase/lipase superfamily enzyme